MSDSGRTDRALDTLACGLDLLGYSDGEKALQESVDRMTDLIRHSDFMTVPDDFMAVEAGAIFDLQRSDREDAGLIPPSSFVFQTLPGDNNILPDSLFEAVPHIGSVAKKESAAMFVTNCVMGDSFRIDDKLPLFIFADLGHPLTQAVVVADMYSRLHDKLRDPTATYMVSTEDKTALAQGAGIMNSASVITRLVAAEDTSGDTFDWIRHRMNNYADYLAGVAEEVWTPAPEGTLMAEASEFEELTEGIFAPFLHALGWKQHAANLGVDPVNAAYSIGRLISERQPY